MPDGMYSVLALLPEASDFTPEAAVAHFGKQRWGKTRVRAELAVPKGKRKPTGFRVYYGDWAVVAWLESGAEVRADSAGIADSEDDLPAPAEEIAACSRRLSVWSDEDPELAYADQIGHFTDELRERFGAFIYDDVNGGWWT